MPGSNPLQSQPRARCRYVGWISKDSQDAAVKLFGQLQLRFAHTARWHPQESRALFCVEGSSRGGHASGDSRAVYRPKVTARARRHLGERNLPHRRQGKSRCLENRHLQIGSEISLCIRLARWLKVVHIGVSKETGRHFPFTLTCGCDILSSLACFFCSFPTLFI